MNNLKLCFSLCLALLQISGPLSGQVVFEETESKYPKDVIGTLNGQYLIREIDSKIFDASSSIYAMYQAEYHLYNKAEDDYSISLEVDDLDGLSDPRVIAERVKDESLFLVIIDMDKDGDRLIWARFNEQLELDSIKVLRTSKLNAVNTFYAASLSVDGQYFFVSSIEASAFHYHGFETFSMFSLDNGEHVFTKSFPIQGGAYDFIKRLNKEMIDVEMDHQGNVYILSPLGKMFVFLKDQDYNVWLLPLRPSDLSPLQYLHGAEMQPLSNGRLLVTADLIDYVGSIEYDLNTYSSFRRVAVLSYLVDVESKQVEFVDRYDLPSSEWKTKADRESSFFALSKGSQYFRARIIELGQGRFLRVSEERRKKHSMPQLAYAPTIFSNLLVSEIDSTGKINYTRLLHKSQVTIDHDLSGASYFYTKQDNRLMLAFYQLSEKDQGFKGLLYTANDLKFESTLSNCDLFVYSYDYKKQELSEKIYPGPQPIWGEFYPLISDYNAELIEGVPSLGMTGILDKTLLELRELPDFLKLKP